MAEYLIRHKDGDIDKVADKMNVDDFLKDWGVDASVATRGGIDISSIVIVTTRTSPCRTFLGGGR